MTKEYETYCEMQQEYRSFVQLNYILLHNHLYTLNDDIFAASFLQAIELNTRGGVTTDIICRVSGHLFI